MSSMIPRAWLLATAASIATVSAAQAQPTFRFNLPGQPLNAAVRSLGRQTGFNILVDSEAGSVMAPPVKGEMTVLEALMRLTAGKGMAVMAAGDRSFSIGYSRPALKAASTTPAALPTAPSLSPGRSADSYPVETQLASAGSGRVAFAQAEPQGGAPAPPPKAAAIEEVVVTGSRVIKNGNASPTPVTVVSTDQLMDVKPGPVADALAELPAFAGSRTATGNPGTGTTNTGANHLNLRYLGYNRTLILFDGHRVPPTTYDQTTDIDMIPQMLLQRVDLATGGVGAVYGSDAVAGVVNFVTDAKFNGLKINVEGGVAQAGDDRTITAGIALGRRLFNDRGHLEVSYQYHDDPGILHRSDRPWGALVWSEQGAGTTAAPFRLTPNTRSSTSGFGGVISAATGTGAALNGQQFMTDGVLSPFVHGAPTGTAGTESGGSGAYPDGSLKSALNSHQAFGRFDYEVTDTVHAYVEGTFTHNRALNFGTYNNINALSFNGQNAFLPSNYQFTGTFKLSELMKDMPRIDTNSVQDQYFVIGGLTGKLGDYSWEMAASHSQARSTTRDDNAINNQKFFAALDAVKDPAGNIVCHVTLTNPGLYPGCAPLNPFGPTAASAAALAYINQPTQFAVTNGMDDLSGSISGSPFKLPAGPVTVALSGEWRNQTLVVASSALPTDAAVCTGLVITGTTTNCTASTKLWADATLANLPQVNNSVGEAAFEVDAPLLKDSFLAKDVSLNGAARFTNYKTSGSAWSWKVGLVWQVTDDWKLRGTHSRDIRAPTLYDLYQPQTTAVGNVNDQLTGVTGVATTFTGGNPRLTPELANTTTAGFVYQPTWLPRLSVSVDAYYIDVTNAIVTQNGTLPGVQTLCYASGGASAFCTLQVRPLGNYTNKTAANTATTWYSATVNISDLKTYGADIEANYTATVFDNPLNLRGLVTWQPHLVNFTPGSDPNDGAGRGFANTGGGGAFAVPIIRLSLFADYRVGNFSIGARERWRTPVTLIGSPSVYAEPTNVPSTYLTDLNLKYRLSQGEAGSSELYLSIQNLFDAQPPPAAGSGQAGNYGLFGGFAFGDDPIGRYFTVGVRFRH